MRSALLCGIGALAACGQDGPVPAGGVAISIDIPNQKLDPTGFTTIDVTMHTASGDIERSAAVSGNNFVLGDFDVMEGVWVEAVLRNESGTAVGYGRTPGPVDITPNEMITVQVRRPIVYIAGLASTDVSGFVENPPWLVARSGVAPGGAGDREAGLHG
ncbi:MAG: hypothetical protein NT062_16270 [Proteobacteria bacterium]|nr:hypothetical protein [Pseudomonadota bacterium]